MNGLKPVVTFGHLCMQVMTTPDRSGSGWKNWQVLYVLYSMRLDEYNENSILSDDEEVGKISLWKFLISKFIFFLEEKI